MPDGGPALESPHGTCHGSMYRIETGPSVHARHRVFLKCGTCGREEDAA